MLERIGKFIKKASEGTQTVAEYRWCDDLEAFYVSTYNEDKSEVYPDEWAVWEPTCKWEIENSTCGLYGEC